MTIRENIVFVMIFSNSMMSHMPRMAIMVKSKTQAIKMYETVFFMVIHKYVIDGTVSDKLPDHKLTEKKLHGVFVQQSIQVSHSAPQCL